MTAAEWGAYLPDFLAGLGVSLRLTAAALGVGLPVGALLGLATTARRAPLRWTCIAIVEVGRGAPGLIVLYLVYYGLPQLDLTWSSFASATLALGLSTAAYSAEVFRAGINAVPAGQREASRALGLSRGAELRFVVLPQAVRTIVPPLAGVAILLFQGTSLAFAIAVPELLSRAYNAATITYQFTATLTVAGAMYAAVSLLAVALLRLPSPGRRIRRSFAAAGTAPHPTDGRSS
ncbi:amino acid ABC transporter permease [Actinomadura luteofluorescens]